MSGPVTDPALIAQLEKGAASGDDVVVQALIDGRMSFPTDSRALNKPYWQKLVQKVSEKDPTFDTIDYKARARTRQDFTSGKSAQNITSFNTLLHHIGTLQQKADELDNFGGAATLLNTPANAMLEAGGSARPGNFRQAKLAVVGEAVRAFRGVGGARGDIEEAAQAIPENGSPEQIRGAVKTLADLLRGRIESLGEQYSHGMGKTSAGVNLLDDKAKAVLQTLSDDPKGGDPASGAAGAVGGSNAPPAGPPGLPEPPKPAADQTDQLVSGDQQPDMKSGFERLKPEQTSLLEQRLKAGASVDELAGLVTGFGRAPDEEGRKNLQALHDFYSKPENAKVPLGVSYARQTVEAVDPKDASPGFGSFVDGVASVVPFSREIAAGIDTIADPSTSLGDNIDKEYGYRKFRQEQNPYLNVAGAIAGSLPIGGLEVAGARAASVASGRAALRAGASRAEAVMAANRTFALRTAADASLQSGVYATGNADGSVGDRLGAGVIGAGIGAVSGGALTYAGGRALAGRAERAAGRATQPLTEGQETLAAAERQGITPFPADVGGGATRRATSAAAQTIGGAQPIIAGARATVDSAQAVRDRVASSIGAAVNPEAAGETARAGAQAFIARTGQRIGRIYDAAANAAGQARIQTPEALRVLNQELAPMEESPVQGAGVAVLQGLRDSLQNSVTVRGLREARTQIRDAFEQSGLRGSNVERVANRVIDAASDDLVNGLQQQGLGRAAAAYRRADRLWRNRLEVIDDHLEPILGRNNAASGEQIVNNLKAAMQGNNRRFAGFVAALPPNEQATVRASLIQRMGQATKGQQDETGEVFSLATFLTNWNEIGERARATLFGPEGRAALNDLARYAAGSKQAQRFANHSNSGGVVGNSLTLAAGIGGIATFGKFVALQYGAGRLLASPRFARWLARAPQAPDPAAQQVYIGRLSRIARAEPAIANEVLHLQDRLLQSFGAGPARAVADEGGQHRAPVERQQRDENRQYQEARP